MITPSLFKNKKVAVLGLGRSGKATAKALLRAGAHVLAWDDQEEACVNALKETLEVTNLHEINWQDVDYLVLSPGIPHQYPAPHPLVARAQLAGVKPISDIEVLCLSQPKASYIGITGTNGKSTTTTLIAHILKETGANIEVGGNLGIPVMDLHPLAEEGVYVLELSSYQLEISPSFHANVSVLLNITPDHLERHGGMEGYIAAKKLIYKNSTLADTLIISVDDASCLSFYEDLNTTKQVSLLPISTHKVLKEGIYVKEGHLYDNAHPVLDLTKLDRLRGQHNWQNITAAYGALRTLGVKTDLIAKSIASFPGLAHRQQVVATHKNVTFINDSKATNAEAVSKALSCFQDHALYCLFGGRAKEGGITSLKPFFPILSHAFLFGEAASAFALTLEGKVPYTLCDTLEEAVTRASSIAFKDTHKDAIVLLSPACASFDQFKDFEARGEAFCRYVEFIIRSTEQQNT